jgi:hypothetical protein
MKLDHVNGERVETENVPDDLVPNEPPHPDLQRLEQFYTIELHSIREFDAQRQDEIHVYGWMKFQWMIDEDDEFHEHYRWDNLSDGVRYWYTEEFVKVPKDGIPEVPMPR